MSFTIPTEAAAFHVHMSQWDKGDLAILQEAAKGNGVMTGCAVTPQGSPDMTVAVAAGSVRTSDNTTHEVTPGNGTITTADATDPRIDIVLATQSGALAVRAGTPNTTPIHPALTAGDVALALVYVEANETAIESSMIVDKRCFPEGHIVIRKEADETLISSATHQDDDHMFFWMGANETWIVHIHMISSGEINFTYAKWGATVPSGATVAFGVLGLDFLDGDGLNQFGIWHSEFVATPDVGNTGSPYLANNAECEIKAIVQNGSTAGLFQLTWAAGASFARTLTVHEGSHLEAWKMAG